jgi:hypothetical protein
VNCFEFNCIRVSFVSEPGQSFNPISENPLIVFFWSAIE